MSLASTAGFGLVPAPLRSRAVDSSPDPERLLRRTLSRARRARTRILYLPRRRAVSNEYGFDRGTPIDRVFIERHLAAHASDVAGACLEVRDARYTTFFGGDRVTRADVLDVDPSNIAATVIADLDSPRSLPKESYDCFILTQTLQYIVDPSTAIENAWWTLRSGGTLLVSAAAIQRMRPWTQTRPHRWGIGPAAMASLLSRFEAVEVEAFGNVALALGTILGLAAEEMTPADFDAADPELPVVVVARAVKA